MTMRYLATGCFQRVTDDFVGVSTSSANSIIHRVCNIIASSHKENINFPRLKWAFKQISKNFMHIVSSPASLALQTVRMFLFRTPVVILQKYRLQKQKRIPFHQCTGMTVFSIS